MIHESRDQRYLYLPSALVMPFSVAAAKKTPTR
jgi:hypothetical protein